MRKERGQILPIVAFLIVGMAGVGLVVAHVGAAANTQARAQTAADAAALAAAWGSDVEARTAASANDAHVVWVRREGTGVLVKVAIGNRSARARARLDGGLQAGGQRW